MSAQNLSSSMKKMALGTAGRAPAPKVQATSQQRPPAGTVITDKAKAMAAFNNAVKNRLVKPVNVQITSVPAIRIREGTFMYDAKAKKSVFKPAAKR